MVVGDMDQADLVRWAASEIRQVEKILKGRGFNDPAIQKLIRAHGYLEHVERLRKEELAEKGGIHEPG